MKTIVRMLLILLAILVIEPVNAEKKTCVLLNGTTAPCGIFGFIDPQTGGLYSKQGPVSLDVTYNSSASDEIKSIRPKNQRQFTATYSDGHQSDFYIDRDGAVKKGIPTGSLP